MTMSEVDRWLKDWKATLQIYWNADFAGWTARLSLDSGRIVTANGQETIELAIHRAIELMEEACLSPRD